ncbi:MAG: hypothetical protein KDD27_25885 [Saprospiraceae bacterium]|nr:hypothetical protein [Saprospiraceae bacterium]
MKIDDAIAAIKEFFLEVLGFLLPGFTLLLLSYLFMRDEVKEGIDSFLTKEHSSTIVLIVSYNLGYVLFGISDAWHKYKKVGNPTWLFKFLRYCKLIEVKPFIEEVQDSIKKSPEYKVAIEIIHEKIGIEKDILESIGVNSVRNLAMSYVPEVDRKIYNFMFRSELSDKVNIAVKIILIFGFFSWLIEVTIGSYSLLKTDTTSLFIYFSFWPIAFFLRKTQRRFFDIAWRIVFPIFVVKYKMQVEKKKEGNEQA